MVAIRRETLFLIMEKCSRHEKGCEDHGEGNDGSYGPFIIMLGLLQNRTLQSSTRRLMTPSQKILA
jgi:hypothetical protein